MQTKTIKYIQIDSKRELSEFKNKLEGALQPVLTKKRKALIENNPGLRMKFAKINKLAVKNGNDRLVAIFKMYLESGKS
jgi:hypothetical protein